MANIKKITDNFMVKYFLNSEEFQAIYDTESYRYEMPSHIDDRLRGATGQFSGTQRPTGLRVFMILKTLDVISTETVSEIINRKKIAIDGHGYSEAYIRQWVNTLTCASQSINHYLMTR